MGLRVRNDRELRAAILPKIKEAVEYLMQLIEADNRSLIDKLVYSYDPQVYERQGADGGFQEAWGSVVEEKQASGRVTGQFSYQPENMSPRHYNSSDGMYHHGSYDVAWGDARDFLADLIYNGDSGPLYGNGPWTRKRDAWSALIKQLGTQRFDRYMKAGFAKAGLPVKKIGRSIKT